MIKTPFHLGGHCHITHIDLGAMAMLKNELALKSVIDVGCGLGHMEKICDSMGISWTGIDGDPLCARENVISHDFTLGEIITEPRDLVWSVEFVEHVDEKFLPNVMSAFRLASKAICMTHALPGKKGHHHVNCQLPEYWINKITSLGYELNIDLTQKLRSVSSMRREFMRNTGMIFTTP